MALLTEDALLTMPPSPLEYQGHAAIAEFFHTRTWRKNLGGPAGARPRQQPARVGYYRADTHTPVARAHSLIVLTLADDKICAITRFGDNSLFGHFGMPDPAQLAGCRPGHDIRFTPAGEPSTSRSTRTARCRGGRRCSPATNANATASLVS